MRRIGDGLMAKQIEAIAARARKKQAQHGENMANAYLEHMRHLHKMEQEAWLEDESGIPPRIARMLITGEVDVDSWPCRSLRGALEAGNRLVGILGPPGTGKTIAGAWALYARRCAIDERTLHDDMAPRPKAGLFVTAHRFTAIAPWDQIDSRPANARFLVLDDIGREHRDKRGQIEELMFHRYDVDLPTIFTGNMTQDQLAATYDPRFLSRLGEIGTLVWAKKVLRKRKLQ